MHSKSRTRYALFTVTAIAMLVTLAGTLFAAGQTTIKLFNGTPVSTELTSSAARLAGTVRRDIETYLRAVSAG